MAALDNVCFVQVVRNQMIAFWVSFVLSLSVSSFISSLYIVTGSSKFEQTTGFILLLKNSFVKGSVFVHGEMCKEIILWSENGISLQEGAE